jgi:exopolysaccharide biosynthesis polyprenyl glycosylphosphotransferase
MPAQRAAEAHQAPYTTPLKVARSLGPHARKSRRRRTPFWLAAADGIAVAGGAGYGLATGAFTTNGHVPAIVTMSVVLSTLAALQMYRPRLSPSLLDDAPYVVGATVAGLVAGLAIHSVVGGLGDLDRFAFAMTIVFVLLLAGRGAVHGLIRWARRTGNARHTCVVIGTGAVGRQLAGALVTHREFGLDVLGFVEEKRPDGIEPGQPRAMPLGAGADLERLIAERGIKVVIIAFGSLVERQLIDVLRTCERSRCQMYFVPRLYEVHSTTRDMEQIRGIPLVRVRRAPYLRFSWRLKRVADVLVAGAAIVVCSPVLAACALAVRLETGRGIIFRQDRVGLDGRSFSLLKFVTLRPTDELDAATTWTVATDDRIGPVGRVLRRTSLDELPQLWNILRGDMSLVGPRPERPYFVRQFERDIPRYSARHRVHTGLTGWAQINGLRGDTSIEDRAVFDNYYIENWSLWGDFKIMIRTVRQVFRAGEH